MDKKIRRKGEKMGEIPNYSQFTKKRNTKEVNNLILRIMWSLLCIPLMVMLLSLLNVFKISWKYSFNWFWVCVVINIILVGLKKTKLSEEVLKYIYMIAFEAVIMVVATEALMGIYSTYILVPIVSCAYLDKKFTGRISIICYIMMLVALYFRSKEAIIVDYKDYDRMQWFISYASGYTLEYIALTWGIRLLSIRTQNFLMSLTEHNQKIISMQQHTIGSFADLIESRDDSTGQHVKRTSNIVSVIVNGMKEQGIYKEQMTNEFCDLLCQAAPLHDIGKIKIPDSILCKPGKLTDEEFEMIKTHTTAGAEIISKSLTELEEEEFIQMAKDIALYHHEKWDGTGYPTGISKDEIPISARVMAVADVFDALITKRCYKDAIGINEAFGIIEEGRGTHFDPLIVDVFLGQKETLINMLGM